MIYPQRLPNAAIDNQISGIKFISFYCIIMCILCMNLFIYSMTRGDLMRRYNPIFEVVSRPAINVLSSKILVVIILLITSSSVLIMAAKLMIHSLMIPWLAGFGLIFACHLAFGLYQLMTVPFSFSSIFNYIWIAINIYCWIFVYSKFRFIRYIRTYNIQTLRT